MHWTYAEYYSICIFQRACCCLLYNALIYLKTMIDHIKMLIGLHCAIASSEQCAARFKRVGHFELCLSQNHNSSTNCAPNSGQGLGLYSRFIDKRSSFARVNALFALYTFTLQWSAKFETFELIRATFDFLYTE